MRRSTRFLFLIAAIAVAAALWPPAAQAQRRHPVRRGAVVFVGGYFYDPFFAPYPWWSRGAYPYPYYPAYGYRAEMRVLVTPREAAVYVDGFYAGIVDDFNGFFQALPLPPRGHDIALYLDGYRTVHQRIYLAPGSTFKLRYTMERLPAGERSEPPDVAPDVPPPPPGSFVPPRTPPRTPPPPRPAPVPPDETAGTLELRVQPARAEVSIDGARWSSSDGERFRIDLPAGTHRLEVTKNGYRGFSGDIQIQDGQTTPVNVALTPERRE